MVWKSEKHLKAERARKRREIEQEIKVLTKQCDELFEKWVFKKAIDEDFVRKEAERVYLDIKQLQTRHNAI
nr:MAG TPA: hypothetical protein [Caudoviricetes sp.]